MKQSKYIEKRAHIRYIIFGKMSMILHIIMLVYKFRIIAGTH